MATENSGTNTKTQKSTDTIDELKDYIFELVNPKAPSQYVPPEQVNIKERNRNLSAQWSKLTGSSSLAGVYDLAITPPFRKCEQCNFTFIRDETYEQHLKKSHENPSQ